MVAYNCHHTVRIIVMARLSLHGAVLGRSLVELALESDRGVVSTENLHARAVQVRFQVLVQMDGYIKRQKASGLAYTVRKGPFKPVRLARYQINRPSPSCLA